MSSHTICSRFPPCTPFDGHRCPFAPIKPAGALLAVAAIVVLASPVCYDMFVTADERQDRSRRI
jgi:hypothetical protein